MKKINGGKLTLSLIIYIIGGFIVTLLIYLLLYLLCLILQIPVFSFITKIFFDELVEPIDLIFSSPILSKLIPSLVNVCSLYITYQISDRINLGTQRTHFLATFIYGIITVSFRVLFIVINLICLDFQIIDIILLIAGIFLIFIGKKEAF